MLPLRNAPSFYGKGINDRIVKLIFRRKRMAKSQTQCTCKLENEDTDFSSMLQGIKTEAHIPGTSVVAFIRACHKCGKYRMSLKKHTQSMTEAPKMGEGTN